MVSHDPISLRCPFSLAGIHEYIEFPVAMLERLLLTTFAFDVFCRLTIE
jgi:hypothetical protein